MWHSGSETNTSDDKHVRDVHGNKTSVTRTPDIPQLARLKTSLNKEY